MSWTPRAQRVTVTEACRQNARGSGERGFSLGCGVQGDFLAEAVGLVPSSGGVCMVFEQGAVRCSRECDVAVGVYRTRGGGQGRAVGYGGEAKVLRGPRGEADSAGERMLKRLVTKWVEGRGQEGGP